ncbi:RICIN domain-containing protein [Streptomyces sp. NPDC048479]|uniref:RICIN domain-containing protein n=1 Tax=Streptomyces sp. NPDC048479 TaxID=3154725 RepID=UPI00342CB883
MAPSPVASVPSSPAGTSLPTRSAPSEDSSEDVVADEVGNLVNREPAKAKFPPLAADAERADSSGESTSQHDSETDAPPAQAAPAGGPSGQITGLAGKCVDVAKASTANFTQVQLFDCNGSAAQHWTMAGDGSIRALGKCLNVASGSTGASVQLYDCNGTDIQHWSYNLSTNEVVNTSSAKCLDVPAYNTTNSTRLQIYDCNSGANQKWHIPM